MQGKILIIDSISTNRIVLKVKLSAAFYHVLQAGSIAEGLEIIEAEKPDLVVSAMKLPDGSVSDLCKHLRGNRHAPIVPVLAIGCGTNEDTRLETLHAGATEGMHRPLNETLLLGRVRNMIRMHNQLDEWQIRDDTRCALGLAEAPDELNAPGKNHPDWAGYSPLSKLGASVITAPSSRVHYYPFTGFNGRHAGNKRA